MSNQTSLEVQFLEETFEDNINELITESAIEVMILWSATFPKRELIFDRNSFTCPSIDNQPLYEFLGSSWNEGRYYANTNISPRMAGMFQPLEDLMDLIAGTQFAKPNIDKIRFIPSRGVIEWGIGETISTRKKED